MVLPAGTVTKDAAGRVVKRTDGRAQRSDGLAGHDTCSCNCPTGACGSMWGSVYDGSAWSAAFLTAKWCGPCEPTDWVFPPQVEAGDLRCSAVKTLCGGTCNTASGGDGCETPAPPDPPSGTGSQTGSADCATSSLICKYVSLWRFNTRTGARTQLVGSYGGLTYPYITCDTPGVGGTGYAWRGAGYVGGDLVADYTLFTTGISCGTYACPAIEPFPTPLEYPVPSFCVVQWSAVYDCNALAWYNGGVPTATAYCVPYTALGAGDFDGLWHAQTHSSDSNTTTYLCYQAALMLCGIDTPVVCDGDYGLTPPALPEGNPPADANCDPVWQYCKREWTCVYNLPGDSWTVTLASTACVHPCVPHDYQYVSNTDTDVTYTAVTCQERCTVSGDCGDGTPPDLTGCRPSDTTNFADGVSCG